jgi:thioesterase domain-containing protein
LNGDPVPPTIEAMAASYVDMIQGVEPEGPYLLGGLCHGGLIAFEMARQLERKGQKVGLVAMIGPPAWNPPHWRFVKDSVAAVVSVCGGDPDRATNLLLSIRDRRIRWREFCQYSLKWLEGAANSSLTGGVARTVRLTKRVLSGVLISDRPWAEPIFATATGDHLMSAYQRAVASYVRRPYSGRIAIFWPNEVPVNTLGGPQLQWRSASDPSLGWRRVAPDVEVHPVPGDYTTSITTHVQVLADRMKESVKNARSNRRTDS